MSKSRKIRERSQRRTYIPGEFEAEANEEEKQIVLRDQRCSSSHARPSSHNLRAGETEKATVTMSAAARQRMSRIRQSYEAQLALSANALRLRLRNLEAEIKAHKRKMWVMQRRMSFGIRTTGVSAAKGAAGADLLEQQSPIRHVAAL